METAAGRLLALRGLVYEASRACPGAVGQRAQSCRQVVAECMCVRPSCPPRGGFGSLLPVQSKIPGWNRLKTQLRPSAPVAASPLVPSSLLGEPNSVSFPQLCWECPAMPGPVCSSGFTSQGVSQASCANQQFMGCLESGCAQDMGCANG